MGPFLKRGSHLYLDWEKEICEKQDECVAGACLSQSQVSVKNALKNILVGLTVKEGG